jgi:hypothetical protein
MAVKLAPTFGVGYQAFSNGGIPLNAGTITTTITGGTTPAATYTTAAGNVQNSNPITLDASGRVENEIWLTEGTAYRFVLKDSLGNTLQTWDSISGINDFSTFSASGGSALIGFIQAGSGAVARTAQAKMREVISADDFSGADFSVKLQKAIDSLPVTGGRIDCRGMSDATLTVGTQIDINKPCVIYLPDSLITVASTATAPAFNITKPARLVLGASSSFTDSTPDPRGVYGTKIVAGSGYTDYLMGIINETPFDQFNAAFSTIEGGSLDGNSRAASGINIVGSFNPSVRNMLIARMTIGIGIINANHSQGYSEGSYIDNCYFENCSRAIQTESSAATDSTGHAAWSNNRINIVQANDIGIYIKGGGPYASLVSNTQMWVAAAATNSRGVYVEDYDLEDSCLFERINFEISGAPGFKGFTTGGSTTTGPFYLAATMTGTGTLYDTSNLTRIISYPRVFTVVNGEGQATTGWTAGGSAVLTSVTAGPNGAASAALKVQCDAGGTASARAFQSWQVVIGKRYRVSWAAKVGDAPTVLVRVGTTSAGDQYYSVGAVAPAVWTRYECTFVASSASLFLSVWANGSADTANLFSYYSSAVVEEIGY